MYNILRPVNTAFELELSKDIDAGDVGGPLRYAGG